MRYIQKNRTWELYWTDRNQRFHRYDRMQPTADINVLLAEVDNDPTGIFWR